MARGDRVTVRGGGIFGLACAYECSRRGAHVTLVAPRGVGDGASGGTVGALAPHVPEHWNPKKQFQLESLLMAAEFWASVGGDTGYARTGRIQPLADAAAVARAEERAEGARAHWGDAAIWRVAEAAEFGFAPLSATGLVVHDTLAARIAPRAACAALARALVAAGGEIAAEAPETGAVIHATGWEGLIALGAGNGVKGQSALLRLAVPDAPQIYAESVHIVPHADGTVAIGSTSERDFTDTAPDAQLDVLIGKARALCPALAAAEVIDRWAGIRPRAKSRAPMLGPLPGRPGHFVANGGFKIGFGMAPKIAQVMADLVLEGRDAIPEGFRVTDVL